MSAPPGPVRDALADALAASLDGSLPLGPSQRRFAS